MRTITLIIAACIFAGCTATTSNSNQSPANALATPETASNLDPQAIPEELRPSVLKPNENEVPAAVRAIEVQIDRKQTIMADEILIEVSCNYEWDVALTGNTVSKQVADRGGQRSEAIGSPRAIFRNLDLRARNKITFWKSGLDVTPFIRVVAKGRVSHVDADATGVYRVKRATTIRIDNANLTTQSEATTVGSTDK